MKKYAVELEIGTIEAEAGVIINAVCFAAASGMKLPEWVVFEDPTSTMEVHLKASDFSTPASALKAFDAQLLAIDAEMAEV
jgi:hypothetical protein